MARRVLIVDDEAPIRQMIEFALKRSDFECVHAADVAEARRAIVERQPDLILLDWMLPGTSGVEFAFSLKKGNTTREIPIIMITAKEEEDHKVRGLEAGADDYITKPFSPRELIARIKAVLRRITPDATEPIEFHGLRLDATSHRVTANGKEIDMGPTEFRLLRFLMAHPDRVYNRSQLLDRVWGERAYIEERTIDVHVRRLRKALAPHGHDKLIQTVRGTGYRFSP
jgi:two-component system phosphate regulon response regulator PhoB